MSTPTTTQARNFWQAFVRRRASEPEATPAPIADRPRATPGPEFDLAPNDPLVAYLLSTGGPAEVDRLELASPALRALKAASVCCASYLRR